MNDLFSWTYSGVNYSLAGNGGEECLQYIPNYQKLIETVLISAVGFLEIKTSYPHLKLADVPVNSSSNVDRFGKKLLLVVMSLTFGIELGFKFATRQMIWILNPCHLVTMMQIFLLLAPPSRLVMAVFRLHIHFLSGATIAILLPVVNTRLLPFETQVYYLQHVLMLVIPFYLMRLGGVYSVEPLTDPYWDLMSVGIMMTYHFLPLQLIAILSQVNLNSILCPAISDPFYGRCFRIWAFFHQTALIFLHGKLYTFLALLLIPQVQRVTQVTSNGHVKLE